MADSLRGLKVARFLKLTRLIRFNRMLNKWQAMSAKKWQLNATRLLKLILMLLLSAHFMGCIWMFTAVEHGIKHARTRAVNKKKHELRAFQKGYSGENQGIALVCVCWPSLTIVVYSTDCGVWISEMDDALSERTGKGGEVAYGCSCRPARAGYENCKPVNWLAKYDMNQFLFGSWGDKYVTSAYFTIVGLSTVGFGDITPANTTERILSIVFVLLGALLFAIVIGSVSEIAQQVHLNLICHPFFALIVCATLFRVLFLCIEHKVGSV
jgi:hypothetical protein